MSLAELWSSPSMSPECQAPKGVSPFLFPQLWFSPLRVSRQHEVRGQGLPRGLLGAHYCLLLTEPLGSFCLLVTCSPLGRCLQTAGLFNPLSTWSAWNSSETSAGMKP